MMTNLHDDYYLTNTMTNFLNTTQFIYIATLPFLIIWNEKWRSESNILITNHELGIEHSSSAAVNTLPNTIICLKAVKYLNTRLRQIY